MGHSEGQSLPPPPPLEVYEQERWESSCAEGSLRFQWVRAGVREGPRGYFCPSDQRLEGPKYGAVERTGSGGSNSIGGVCGPSTCQWRDEGPHES